MGLLFTIAAGPRQRNHSEVRVRPHFTISDSRLPEPGGPGPRIYIPQEPVGPVIPPVTGFPFLRLLQRAELRWRYSTPPPHGMTAARLVSSLYDPWHGPRRKRRFQQFLYCCASLVAVGTSLFRGRQLVTGLHTTILSLPIVLYFTPLTGV
jgi:hypothetical protein